MSENEFPKGMYYKLPAPTAPDFVKGKLSIKVAEALEYLQGKFKADQEWLNLDIKVSKQGKGYLAVNTWKPNQGGQSVHQETPSKEAFGDDIPDFEITGDEVLF